MPRGSCKFKTMDMSNGTFNKDFEDTKVPEIQDIEAKELNGQLFLEEFANDIEIKSPVTDLIKRTAGSVSKKLATGAVWGVGSYTAGQALEEAQKKIKPNMFIQRRTVNKIEDIKAKEISDDIEIKGKFTQWVGSKAKNLTGRFKPKTTIEHGIEDTIKDSSTKEKAKKVGRYVGDKLASGALVGSGVLAAHKIANKKPYRLETDDGNPVKVRVVVQNKKKNTEIKRTKGYEDIQVKELDDDIEVKAILPGVMNVGRKLFNTGKKVVRQGKTAFTKKPEAFAKPLKMGQKENLKLRKFDLGNSGVNVTRQAKRVSKTPLEAQKLARSKRSNRRLLLGGIGAAGAGGLAYGAGKTSGEHETRQKLKNRPYWMDEE